MTNSFNFVIRDGVPDDIDACLYLDHTYETEHVWQMSIQPETLGYRVTFRTERLPRPVEYEYPIERHRLELSFAPDTCLLVACGKNEPEMLGYLTMRHDALYRITIIQTLLVARQYRGRGIGSRLLNIARRWAQERAAQRLLIEIHTKNYPAIQFVQARGLAFCGFNDQYFPKHEIALFFGQSLR
jgi:GNAT superfamily N-acetyltransferase